MDSFLQAAIEEEKKGLTAGDTPIGSVLELDGTIIVPRFVKKQSTWRKLLEARDRDRLLSKGYSGKTPKVR